MPNGIVAFLASGYNSVWISGQAVSLATNAISGNVVQSRIYDASTGQFANIFVTNNDAVSPSNFALQSQALLYGFHPTNNAWGRVGLTSPVSGEGYRLLAAISGQTVAIAGGISSNVSGNIVYLASGQNLVQISGQTVSIAGGINTSISGQPVLISGQTVSIAGSISTTAGVSGQTVYLASGQNSVQISGQTVSIAGGINTSISGQPLLISGQTVIAKISGESVSIIGTVPVSTLVSVSGNVVRISGETVSIAGSISTTAGVSGQTVYLASGQNSVQISGQSINILGTVPVSVAAVLPVSTSVSGNAILISGQTVSIAGSISTTAGVSGQTVYLASGQNSVQISGQSVNILGTVPVTGSFSANVSGNVVYLTSGQNSVQISGQSVSVLGTVPVTLASTIAAISGQTVVAKVSGEPVRLSDGVGNLLTTTLAGSQNALVVSISGQPVTASIQQGPTNISGQVVYLASGSNGVQTSGQTLNAFTYGFDPTTGLWRANQITISGDGGRLIVSISGQPISISGQSVREVSGSITSISGQTVALQSGTNEVMVGAAPTYYAVANNIIPLSGRHAMSIFLPSGTPVVKVKGLFMTNNEPKLISGQHLRWDINQINLAPQSGLGISPIPTDRRDPISGLSMIVMANPFGSVSGVLLFPYITTTQGTHPTFGTIQSGTSTAMLQAHMLQSVNLIPQSAEVKEINITSGYGISVQQTTVSGYTQVTSGQFSILMVYTLNM